MSRIGPFKLIVSFVIFTLLIISGCYLSKKDRFYKETRISMYTVVSITVLTNSEKEAAHIIDKAYKELDRLADLLNFYSEDSEISFINKNAGIKPVKVSQETFEIIEKALFVSSKTDGAFDITIGPVMKLWDFKDKRLPNKKELEEKLKTVGYKNIILDEKNKTIFIKKKGVEIDLGGIIKGYAADKIAHLLKNNGIKAGLIAVGGDIKTFGIRPDNKPWTIGIQNPRQTSKEDEIIATIKLNSEKAISTSGDYEKYFLLNGVRYHHLLDPKTGYPVDKNRSVTIISEESALSDAFATAIFLIDAPKGIEILKRLGLEGIIIDKDGKIFITDGIKDRLSLIAPKMSFSGLRHEQCQAELVEASVEALTRESKVSREKGNPVPYI